MAGTVRAAGAHPDLVVPHHQGLHSIVGQAGVGSEAVTGGTQAVPDIIVFICNCSSVIQHTHPAAIAPAGIVGAEPDCVAPL